MTSMPMDAPSRPKRNTLGRQKKRGQLIPVLFSLTFLGMPALLYWVGRTHIRWELEGRQSRLREEVKSEGEFMIGAFHERNDSFPATPVVVDLKLYADLTPKDGPKYEAVMKEKHGEIRGAVSTVIRSVPTKDLREPTLATLKRKMKVAMAKAYGRETDIFDNLVIPDFDAYPIN